MGKIICFIIMFCICVTASYAQDECGCSSDTIYNGDGYCDQVTLKNQSRLYYQFNCDSTWLTLENKDGNKYVLNSLEFDLIGLRDRLGYYLCCEYPNALLFRYGCSANGPCMFALTSNEDGKLIRLFDELIYKHDEDNDNPDNNGYLLYFDYKQNMAITAYNVQTGKEYTKVVNRNDFGDIIPEYQFTNISLEKGELVLEYQKSDSKQQKKIRLKVGD